jgi:glycosyltransferase involved in cell wall biosynthesis
MKVMLVVPHLSDGGGERVASDLSCSLRADDLSLAVFETRPGYPYRGRLLSLELPIDRRSVLTRVRGFLKRCLRFRRLLRKERPDTVLSFMGEANLINALLSPRPIVTVHNQPLSFPALIGAAAARGPARMRARFEAAMHRQLIGALFRRATVVAVSESIRRELIAGFRIPPARIVTIANAVNAQEIREKSAESAAFPWSGSPPVVITSGRLTMAKGQWHLLRAFAESRKTMPCRLVILGAGELESYLRGLAAELRIQDDVFFAGWQANPHRFVARATVFVLPSLSEGFGLAALEAMACGVPVVAADCPGEVREILAPGTAGRPAITEPEFARYGVLIPAFDVAMRSGSDPLTASERRLSDVIVQFIADPELRDRYANAGSSRVRDFDHRAFIDNYQRLIERVAASSKEPPAKP